MPSSSNGDQIKESDRMSTQLPIPKTSIRNGSAKYGTTNEIRRACETKKPPPHATRRTTGIGPNKRTIPNNGNGNSGFNNALYQSTNDKRRTQQRRYPPLEVKYSVLPNTTTEPPTCHNVRGAIGWNNSASND